MRFVKEETILKEAKAKDRMIDALSNRSTSKATATRQAERGGGFVVILEEGGYLACAWTKEKAG